MTEVEKAKNALTAPPRISFEEACKISHEMATVDRLCTLGMEETMRQHRQALANVGWTIAGLLAESAQRMQERINMRLAQEELVILNKMEPI